MSFNVKPEEVIFTRNSTEGINLVAHSFPFKANDKIIVSTKEHNSNLLPMQTKNKQRTSIHMGILRKKIRRTMEKSTLRLLDSRTRHRRNKSSR